MAIDYGELEEGRGVSYWAYDPVLRREVRRTYPDEAFEWARGRLDDFGETVGTVMADNSDVVDEHDPELHTYDRDGEVINEVEYHPAQIENERLTYDAGVVADSFQAPPGRDEPMPLTYNLTMGYLLGSIDIGLGCPMAMTAGAALVLEKFGDDLHDPYFEGMTARDYEAFMDGAMFLTEIQGGSDVGANETIAEHVEDRTYELTGEKWFTSNIDADVVLALARRPDAPEGTAGLSLFLVPGEKPDGEGNDFYFRRLKDKLGTKSVPTGEVEMEGTMGYLVGEPEEGFKYMAEMLNMERLHNAMASVGVMSRALLESKVHAENRDAFGGPLAEKPLMQRDLVDMTVDHEAATAFAFDAAREFDRYHRGDDEDAYRLMRMLVPVAKHRTGRMAVDQTSYAIEIQGGDGYVSDWVTHRLLRDAQVLPVWEGTSNILSLDVLRAMAKEAAHVPVLDRVRERLDGLDERLDGLVDTVREELSGLEESLTAIGTADPDYAEMQAKELADYLFDVYSAALLLAEADRDLADGDARKALVARWFVERHLRHRDGRGIPDGLDLPMEQFDAISRFDTVDPSVLEPEPAPAD